MGRQKVRIDQLVVPPGTPDGHRPAVVLGELTYEAPGAGSGGVAVEDEGVEVVTSAARLNFTGSGVTVTDAGSGEATVSIPGGGGGGGSSLRSVDDPADPSWGTASAYDVEFDTDGTTLPSGWSWVNQGTSTWEQKFGAGILTHEFGAPRIIARALPTASSWTAYAKVDQTSTFVNWQRVGMCLRESSTGKLTQFTFTSTNASGWNTRNAAVNDWNASTFFGNEVKSGNFVYAQYLRITKNAGGTYDFAYSNSGISWRPLVTSKTPYGTYDQIGLTSAADTSQSAATVAPGVFHWFRVR